MDRVAQKARDLIPYLNAPNFKEIKEEVLQTDTSINAFLLNMELRRLCAPSVRIIDFRRDGPCVEFCYGNIKHFLLAEDVEEFKQLLDMYNGVYSNGLYEELVRNHNARKRLKNEEAISANEESNIPNRFSVDCIKFASYSHRRDERMFYCSPIIITFANGKKLEAKTSDLSCSGIKILLPMQMPFAGKETISITFTGLIEHFPKYGKLLSNANYETLGIETKDTRAWLKTRYLDENKDFEQFILRFQEANRYRYRIDTDYFAYTLNIKAMEFEYLPKVRGITLFFSQNEYLEPVFALKSDYNHDDLDYWRDERSDDKLRSLFTPERLERISKQQKDIKKTTIYCFKHTAQNHVYFLCATLEELQEKNLVATFFRMAATHSSFRVYQFELAPIDNSPNKIKNITADINCQNPELISKEIMPLTHIGMLTRIDTPNDLKIYSDFTSELSANSLQCFTLKTDNITPIKLEYLQYTKARAETRYIYKTPVLVYGSHLQPVTGWTRDLSLTGLQIELSAPVECYNNDVIYISLPKLQELSKKISLENIAYDVIFVNSAHTILHLRLHNRTKEEPISNFLGELFKANSTVLEQTKEIPQMSMLSKALRSMTISNLFSTPIIFMRGCVNRLGYICQSKNGTTVSNLFNIYNHPQNKCNIFPLLSNSVIKDHIMPGLQQIKNTEKQNQINIYIKRCKTDIGFSYIPQVEDDFLTNKDKQNFIQEGLEQGYFGAFALFLSITGRPNTLEIKQELAYLRRAAPHKFKNLENKIWSKFGFGDVIDITESVLQKNRFFSQKVLDVPNETLEN